MNPLAYLTAAGGAAIGVLVVWLFMSLVTVPNAAHAAREGYVLQAEKTTAEAKATEMERQLKAASAALADNQSRQSADEAFNQQMQVQTDKELSEYEKKLQAANRQCLLDSSDSIWLQSH